MLPVTWQMYHYSLIFCWSPSNVIFFFFTGSNLDEVLLPIDSILEAEELGELRSDRKFQYLIRLGYEHFQKIEPCS